MLSLTVKQSVQNMLGRFGYALVKLPTRGAPANYKGPILKSRLVRVLRNVLDQVVRDNIDGDIVDCGVGETDILFGLADLLVKKRDTGRKLVLFDTSMDCTHRAETNMQLWGSTSLPPFHAASRSGGNFVGPALPNELIVTGYPAQNIVVETQATDRAIQSKLPRQIALLVMSCDRHKAHMIVLQRLLQRLSKGAVIIVRNYVPADGDTNPAIRLLWSQIPGLDLVHSWETYWTATT